MAEPLFSEGCAARALATALEPVVGSVYFAPEAHRAYEALGFAASPGSIADGGWGEAHWGRVMMHDGVTYFASRGGLLGQVHGQVVAAAFGVFNPAAVVPAVAAAWQIASAADVVAARSAGAVAQLTRILGADPEGLPTAIALLGRAVAPLSLAGRPMFAGVTAQRPPDEPIGRMWHLGDQLREYRGDAHVAAFAASGFDGCQFQVLTERCAGMPPRTYTLTRAWDADQLDDAEHRLTSLGLLDGGTVTEAGRAAREAVEVETDVQCLPMIEALGADVVELVGILQPWGDAIRAADGYYPSSPQLATLHPAVDEWMRANGLAPFAA
jgi:hypothetical protein